MKIGASQGLPQTRAVAKPILPVSDMPRALAFYADLGFDVRPYDAEYAWVRHCGDEILHLRLDEGAAGAAQFGVYLHVSGAERWHATLQERGAAVSALVDEPWGMREFHLVDPFGNLLRIGGNR